MSIPTAREFLKNYKNDSDHYADQDYSEDRLVRALQEFTKLHLEKCKKEISVLIVESDDISFDILNEHIKIEDVYPLDNIK